MAKWVGSAVLALVCVLVLSACDEDKKVAYAETVEVAEGKALGHRNPRVVDLPRDETSQPVVEPAPAPTPAPAPEPAPEPAPVPQPVPETEPSPAPAPEPAPVAPEEPLPEPEVGSTQGLGVTLLSNRSAKVEWLTEIPSDSEVRWGVTPQLEATPILQPAPVLAHTVLLTGLLAGQTYYVQAVSKASDVELVESEITSFQAMANDSYSVRRTHPRIIFTSDDLPWIRSRIAGSHASSWTALVRACEGALAKDPATIAAGDSVYVYSRALAFAGLVGDRDAFRKKAQDIALRTAALGAAGEKMDVRQRLLAISLVYDWIHPYLSESTRSTLKSRALEMYGRLEADNKLSEFVWGHTHGNHRPMIISALAFHGESPELTSKLDSLVSAYRKGFLPTWRNYGEEGGSLKGWWYTTWTLDMEVDVFAAVKSALGLDWYASESWYEKLVDWYALGLRGDGHFLKSGDTRVGVGVTHFDYVYALSVVHNCRSPRAKWLAAKMKSLTDVWALYNFYEIVWNDADIQPEPPSGDSVRLYRTAGHSIMRSSWETNAVIADFRSASDYTQGHTNLDNNSFTVFYRGGLALDSGLYDDYGGSHHLNYSKRTIAHNSILVFDPAEQFMYGRTLCSNDGGQKLLGSADGVSSAAPPNIEAVLDPTKGYRAGGIARFEDTEEYTYSLGNAAPSYNRNKLQVFDRHFLWLKGSTAAEKPVMVVYDYLVSKNGLYKKTYLLHSQNQPTVQGTMVSAANNGGVLFQQTLLPESPRFTVVGGAGKEFVVGSTNYTPVKNAGPEDDAGAWRTEISAASSANVERFLHVLSVGDEGAAFPAQSSRLAASTMRGCLASGWAILFSDSQSGIDEVEYNSTNGFLKHLLVGLVPSATYDISVNGTLQAQVTTSDKGTIRFDTRSQGTVTVSRSASDRV